MEIQLLAGEDLAAANRIYASIGFAPSDPQKDRTFGLVDDDQLTGLGRLQFREDALELGGFWIAEHARGGGLARLLVEHVLQQLKPGQEAWCVPFEHLLGFYRGFGMVDAPPEAAPPGIRAKLGFCAQQRACGVLAHDTGLLRYVRPV